MRVLISGGTRGIGRACVEYFAARGDQVAFLYHSRQDLAEELSRSSGALAFRADVGDPEAVRRAVCSVIDFFGGLDAVVNNAGISQIKLFTDLTDTDTDGEYKHRDSIDNTHGCNCGIAVDTCLMVQN